MYSLMLLFIAVYVVSIAVSSYLLARISIGVEAENPHIFERADREYKKFIMFLNSLNEARGQDDLELPFGHIDTLFSDSFRKNRHVNILKIVYEVSKNPFPPLDLLWDKEKEKKLKLIALEATLLVIEETIDDLNRKREFLSRLDNFDK